jgi:hypothetical protein
VSRRSGTSAPGAAAHRRDRVDHGFIVPVTFIISLFTDDVSVYEVANDGNRYDAGYVLGLVLVLGGGAGSGSAAGRRRR